MDPHNKNVLKQISVEISVQLNISVGMLDFQEIKSDSINT